MVMEAETFPGVPWEASTQTDPQLAGQLTEQALAPTVSMPDVEPPPSNIVELPGGFIDPHGQLHREAVVRELTGRDEEEIARLDVTRNPSSLLRIITKLGLVALGDSVPSDAQLGMLLVGDRNAVVLGIRKATFGNNLPMDVVCPHCQAKESLTLELDKDIPTRTLDEPMERLRDVAISRGTASVLLATAEVEDQMLDMTKATVPERNTHLLTRCVQTINGVPPSHEDILGLSMADRRTLVDFLFDSQPGPQYGEVNLPCGKCKDEFALALSLADLFRY